MPPPTYPVFDCSRHDYDRDCHHIGRATSPAEAMALLAQHFNDNTPDDYRVELADRDTAGTQLWAYWCEPID